MLRTMISDLPFEQRWTLQGRLCGQWAIDLQQKWEESRKAREGHACVVDLEDVISVDRSGEETLFQMVIEGARLIASRAYMKRVIESLKERQP
jgi:hypothetical protein